MKTKYPIGEFRRNRVGKIGKCYWDVILEAFEDKIAYRRGRWEIYYVRNTLGRGTTFFYVHKPHLENSGCGPFEIGLVYDDSDLPWPELFDRCHYAIGSGVIKLPGPFGRTFAVVSTACHTLLRLEKNSDGIDALRRVPMVKIYDYAHARPMEQWGGF